MRATSVVTLSLSLQTLFMNKRTTRLYELPYKRQINIIKEWNTEMANNKAIITCTLCYISDYTSTLFTSTTTNSFNTHWTNYCASRYFHRSTKNIQHFQISWNMCITLLYILMIVTSRFVGNASSAKILNVYMNRLQNQRHRTWLMGS